MDAVLKAVAEHWVWGVLMIPMVGLGWVIKNFDAIRKVKAHLFPGPHDHVTRLKEQLDQVKSVREAVPEAQRPRYDAIVDDLSEQLAQAVEQVYRASLGPAAPAREEGLHTTAKAAAEGVLRDGDAEDRHAIERMIGGDVAGGLDDLAEEARRQDDADAKAAAARWRHIGDLAWWVDTKLALAGCGKTLPSEATA